MVILNTHKSWETFKSSPKCLKMAQLLVGRLDDDICTEDAAKECLLDDIDALWEYDSQWAVIELYSMPDDPKPYYDAYEVFVFEILECCDYLIDEIIDDDLLIDEEAE